MLRAASFLDSSEGKTQATTPSNTNGTSSTNTSASATSTSFNRAIPANTANSQRKKGRKGSVQSSRRLFGAGDVSDGADDVSDGADDVSVVVVADDVSVEVVSDVVGADDKVPVTMAEAWQDLLFPD